MVSHSYTEDLKVQTFRQPGYIDPFFCARARRLIQQSKVDVIHLHRSRDLASFSLLKNVPRVLTLQIESSLAKRDLFHRFVYSRVDRILTITERMRQLALDSLPVPSGKVFTLHYGIDARAQIIAQHDQTEIRRKFNLSQEAFLITLVGRLEPSKGQDVLLKAFAEFYHDYPGVHVLIVGEPPPDGNGYCQKLESLASQLKISDRVHFLGFQSEVTPIYCISDVCVLPSHKESFGLVLLEAMASGVPVVATDAGGVPEIVEDEVNGLLVPPDDVAALSQALVRLIQSPELRRRLAENGSRVVREKFSLEKHLEALENHFAEAVTSRS